MAARAWAAVVFLMLVLLSAAAAASPGRGRACQNRDAGLIQARGDPARRQAYGGWRSPRIHAAMRVASSRSAIARSAPAATSSSIE